MSLKIKFLSIFIVFTSCFSTFIHSQSVNSETAKIVAYNFIKPINTSIKSLADLELAYAETFQINDTAWFVFSLNPRGYIVVSSIENAFPIIAYSKNSDFEMNAKKLPPSFEKWMQWRTNEIAFLHRNSMQADEETQQLWYDLKNGHYTSSPEKVQGVAPLLMSAWNQDCHYNEFCPEDPAGPCQRVYVGCVAIAMGQILYYWRFPTTGIGSKSYWSDYGLLTANFGQSTYNYNEMKGSINSSHPEVAELLHHLGVSVSMMYAPDGSGAFSSDVPDALKSYFGFAQSAVLRNKNQFSNTNWENLLKSNLNKGWPLYYSGFGTGGHAFNIDGYQGTNHFHFDWGWGGSFNGYYFLHNLNPGTFTFNNGQSAIVEIVPANLSYLNVTNAQHVITGISGSFEDGSGAMNNYKPNANIQWTINPSVPVDNIKIDFKYFETENDSDIVTIYQGTTTNDPILGIFSGSSLPPSITSLGQAVLITFTTNSSNNQRGFWAEYTATTTKFCSGIVIINDSFGTIEDGSGTNNYGNNSNCRWIIQPQNSNIISLSFNYFRTESTVDRLLVRNFDTGELVQEFSGTSAPSTLNINASKVQLHFITNPSVSDIGWSIDFTSSTSINETSESNRITIYPNPANSYFTIETSNQNSKISKINIFDITGRLVLNQEISHTTNKLNIDISNLQNGTYFIEAIVNDTVINKKLHKH